MPLVVFILLLLCAPQVSAENCFRRRKIVLSFDGLTLVRTTHGEIKKVLIRKGDCRFEHFVLNKEVVQKYQHHVLALVRKLFRQTSNLNQGQVLKRLLFPVFQSLPTETLRPFLKKHLRRLMSESELYFGDIVFLPKEKMNTLVVYVGYGVGLFATRDKGNMHLKIQRIDARLAESVYRSSLNADLPNMHEVLSLLRIKEKVFSEPEHNKPNPFSLRGGIGFFLEPFSSMQPTYPTFGLGLHLDLLVQKNYLVRLGVFGVKYDAQHLAFKDSEPSATFDWAVHIHGQFGAEWKINQEIALSILPLGLFLEVPISQFHTMIFWGSLSSLCLWYEKWKPFRIGIGLNLRFDFPGLRPGSLWLARFFFSMHVAL